MAYVALGRSFVGGGTQRARRGGGATASSTSMRTFAVPGPIMSMVRAAAYDRSITRPPTNGPRSLIRTSTERPLVRLVTMVREPSGSDGCAAVSSFWSKISPLAVRLPWKPGPYQEAMPTCAPFSTGGGAGASCTSRTREHPELASVRAAPSATAPPHRHHIPDGFLTRPGASAQACERIRLSRIYSPRTLCYDPIVHVGPFQMEHDQAQEGPEGRPPRQAVHEVHQGDHGRRPHGRR